MSNFSTGVIIGQGTNADIDTDEETVVEITELPKLTKTQLTIYINTALATHTSMEYRFYYADSVGGTYHAIPKQNLSTDVIEEYMAEVNSSTPDPFVLEFGLGSCFAFKITGKGVGGANGTSTIKVLARDN